MGEFTQNLLKLTEFPFSYSLMGLLALIFGQSTSAGEEFSFVRISPLLILTGFVATTLSICDPVGVLQRLIVKGKKLWKRPPFPFLGRFIPGDRPVYKNSLDFVIARIFREMLGDIFSDHYIFAIAYSPEDPNKRYSIKWGAEFTRELDKLGTDGFDKIAELLEGLKEQTIKTKWITAEIDRITALVYFIIIISLFIVAIQLYHIFLQNFERIFQGVELAKIVILIFSVLALIAVSIMFILRIRGLLKKALIVFRYLTALGAIKTEKEKFKTTLQEIERYLNDTDWTLTKYWVDRIQKEYTELFVMKSQELQKSRLDKQKTKN